VNPKGIAGVSHTFVSTVPASPDLTTEYEHAAQPVQSASSRSLK